MEIRCWNLKIEHNRKSSINDYFNFSCKDKICWHILIGNLKCSIFAFSLNWSTMIIIFLFSNILQIWSNRLGSKFIFLISIWINYGNLDESRQKPFKTKMFRDGFLNWWYTPLVMLMCIHNAYIYEFGFLFCKFKFYWNDLVSFVRD